MNTRGRTGRNCKQHKNAIGCGELNAWSRRNSNGGRKRGKAAMPQNRTKTGTFAPGTSGNPGGRTLKVLDIPDVSGVDMPKPHDFLSATQRDGGQDQAKEV